MGGDEIMHMDGYNRCSHWVLLGILSEPILFLSLFCVSSVTERMVEAPMVCPRTSPQKIPSMPMNEASAMYDVINARFLHTAHNTE